MDHLAATRRSARTAAGLLTGAALLFLWSRRSRPTVWRGRVAIVTGGARGLGFALARELARAGATVWIVSRSPDQLARAATRLRGLDGEVVAHGADITDRDDVTALVAAVTRRHGRLDVLVNNAGVISAMPFDNAALDDFATSLATHFWGPLHLIRAALPWLRQAGPGHIVNVSSIGGRVGVPHLAPYCAGKFALSGLSQALRAELAAGGVCVTLATPGLMRTGSVGRVRVRGHHVPEARWFAAMAATPLTSMDATRAAREILDAARHGHASVTPGWQAQALAALQAVAPDTTSGLMAAASAHALPAPAPGPSASRTIDTLDLGWARALDSPATQAAYNQP